MKNDHDTIHDTTDLSDTEESFDDSQQREYCNLLCMICETCHFCKSIVFLSTDFALLPCACYLLSVHVFTTLFFIHHLRRDRLYDDRRTPPPRGRDPRDFDPYDRDRLDPYRRDDPRDDPYYRDRDRDRDLLSRDRDDPFR